ncbi:hypothetical protein OG933_07360 [Streptomyces sp. NBC_00016]|uniref:hypothetical protein n=1 Tax=Streptomyces sp. NBC_00016 TaxID=2975622 RepID=UPI00324390B5
MQDGVFSITVPKADVAKPRHGRDQRDERSHREQRLRRERRGSGHPSGTAAGPARPARHPSRRRRRATWLPTVGGSSCRSRRPSSWRTRERTLLSDGARGLKIAARTARRREQECAGARRYRPGTGPGGTLVLAEDGRHRGHGKGYVRHGRTSLDDETEQMIHALQEAGSTSGDRLDQAVGGRSRRPGRFRRALSVSRAKGLANGSHAPADGPGRPDGAPGDPHGQR